MRPATARNRDACRPGVDRGHDLADHHQYANVAHVEAGDPVDRKETPTALDESSPTTRNDERAPDRVTLVQRSLRCLALGILGVLPVIGLPFGIAGLVSYWRTSLSFAGEWNPARPQLLAGLWLSVFSMLEHAFIATVIAILAADEAGLI
jgi:hypothetical protein